MTHSTHFINGYISVGNVCMRKAQQLIDEDRSQVSQASAGHLLGYAVPTTLHENCGVSHLSG